jgi:hypothetical protein
LGSGADGSSDIDGADGETDPCVEPDSCGDGLGLDGEGYPDGERVGIVLVDGEGELLGAGCG